MKWAKLLAALGRIAVALGVKNPNSQAKAEAIGQAVDISIEMTAETLKEGAKEKP